MAKITAQDILNLGFIPGMFGKDNDAELTTLIDAIITEQSTILTGRIGAANYAVATSPTQDYVKRAELCLVAAEMLQRRINQILANVTGSGQEIDTTYEQKQRKDYMDQADILINRVNAGVSADSAGFSHEVLESDHFGTSTS